MSIAIELISSRAEKLESFGLRAGMDGCIIRTVEVDDVALEHINTSSRPSTLCQGLFMAALDRDPISTNLTSPFSWVFNMKRAPSLSYFCQAVKLPDVILDAPGAPSPSILVPEVPDHIRYSDVTINFIVDINFQNWQEILNWMRGIANPSGKGIVYTQLEGAPKTSPYQLFSDVSVIQLDSQNNPLLYWDFKRCIPINLTGPKYDATLTDVNYLTSEVTFRITNFDIGVVGGGS